MMYKLAYRFIQYFCFRDRAIKGGEILNLQKGEILEKGGGGITHLTNYDKVVVYVCP